MLWIGLVVAGHHGDRRGDRPELVDCPEGV
jgi:hypothetical protein